VRDLDPNRKGNIAEAAVVFHAARAGIPVFRPLSEHGRYDLVMEIGRRLLRVQCKWARVVQGVVAIQLASFRFTSQGNVRRAYTAEEIDAVAAYSGELDKCYLLPVDLAAGKASLFLRLDQPKNGQRAAITWAADYELSGAIAQLGERCRGTAEVAGSSPASSTTPRADCDTITIGAHELRERFGYWMERASTRDEILVTRRGKPHVRLLPPRDR
jgi:prevent-host-death family protein